MACKENEMMVLKGTSGKLDDNTLIIMSLMYHTEKDPTDPSGQRNDRSKSSYRYEGRIVKIEDLKKEIAEMEADPEAQWKWPGVEPWVIAYDGYQTNARGAKWLKARINKALPFDAFTKLVFEGIKPTGRSSASAKYETIGYTMDGKPFDVVKDAQVLLTTPGNFSKITK